MEAPATYIDRCLLWRLKQQADESGMTKQQDQAAILTTVERSADKNAG